jgi:hypothetical protein
MTFKFLNYYCLILIVDQKRHLRPVGPSHYRLYVDASQLEQYRFHGTVDIDIQVRKIK